MPVPSYSLIVSLAQATFEPSRPPMGAIIPMAAPAVRQGLVKKQEKEARRAAQLQERASVLGVSNGAGQGLPVAPNKPACTPFERHGRKREPKRKAAARRLKEDVTVSGAVNDLLKAIREGVGIIARVPASVTAAWSLWEATLAEYKRIELTGSAMKAGGHL